MTQVDQNITGDSNQVIGQIDQVVAPVVNLTVYDQLPQIVSQGAVVASQPLTQQEYRQRKVLLNKVKEYWLKGVLERSLHSQVLLELGLEEKPEMVQRPFCEADEFAMTSGEMLPEGTNATSLFDEMGEGRTLLVLGEPGSGKTITLLKLAEALVARAEADLSLPIPVVVNLSSWRRKEKSFSDWLADELFEKYQVSKSIGQDLIQKEALILLLDGLDEVSLELRETCVAHLNRFIQGHGATEISVCCRVRDYEKLSQRLILRCSIYIHPLSFKQVDEYLVQAGEQLSSLRTILETDLELKKIATTPLILSIMSMAYQYYVLEDFQSLPSTGERRRHLLDSYVERMLYRRDSSQDYSNENTKYWLAWLAKNMEKSSTTIFLIEKLQLNFLESDFLRILCRIGSGLACAIFSGTIVLLVFNINHSFKIAYYFGFNFSFAFGLFVSFLGTIRPVSTLEISFQLGKENIAISVVVGLLATFFSSLLLPFSGAYAGGISAALVCLLVTQIRGSGKDSIKTPNEAIWDSLRNALILGTGSAISIFLVYFFILLELALNQTIEDTIVVSFQAGVLGGLMVGLILGGTACICHFFLRLMLYKSRKSPWNYAAFLDYAADRLLLQKVGGGYIFIHRMLLEHFSQMYPALNLSENKGN